MRLLTIIGVVAMVALVIVLGIIFPYFILVYSFSEHFSTLYSSAFDSYFAQTQMRQLLGAHNSKSGCARVMRVEPFGRVENAPDYD